MVTQHPDHGTSFEIANMVEDLINLKSVLYWNFDRMGCAQRIEVERLLDTFSLETVNFWFDIAITSRIPYDKLRPYVPFCGRSLDINQLSKTTKKVEVYQGKSGRRPTSQPKLRTLRSATTHSTNPSSRGYQTIDGQALEIF